MGLPIECISLFIPIRTISLKFHGGWRSFFGSELPRIDGINRDEYLFRMCFMNSLDLDIELTRLKSCGLKLFKIVKGKKIFNDVCVTSLHQDETPCPWIYIKDGFAHYQEAKVVLPSDFNFAKELRSDHGGSSRLV
jgi:hypothetical protein